MSSDMKPLNQLAQAADPEGHLWELWERDGVLSILQDGIQYASSFTHGSEDAMAEVAAAPIVRANQPCIMVAGLGLGYGLAQLCSLIRREKAKFIVAEPLPSIVDWVREHGENGPLLNEDPRIEIELASARELCRKRSSSLHGIILKHTHARCQMDVLEAQDYFNALKGGSLLVIAIAKSDRRLEGILRRAGFDVSYTHVPAAAKGKQMRMHTLIVARRGAWRGRK